MNKNRKLKDKIMLRISIKKCAVFLREDFEDLGEYDQVGRALRQLANDGKILRIGYGLYAKVQKSFLTGDIVPVLPLPTLAREALERLGLKTYPSSYETAYNEGRSTQVPTGRMIGVRDRISRRIGYAGAYVSYEQVPSVADEIPDR
jgi:hypothetical protein